MDVVIANGPRSTHSGAMTFRPALRPGAPLLRRDATHLQVGTRPGVIVPDRPGLLGLLRLLDGVRDVAQLQALARVHAPEVAAEAPELLRRLTADGAVVDGSTLGPSRARLDLAVQADARSRVLAQAVRSVVTDLDLAPAGPAGGGLLLVVTCGESSRAPFERAIVQRLAHLPVVIDEDRVRVGPFVSPGHSPCVSCADHARTDWDPAWSAIIPQLGGRRSVPTAPIASPALLWAAAALVGAEVAAVSRRTRPESFAAVLTLGPVPGARTRTPVAFHHRCGCALLGTA